MKTRTPALALVCTCLLFSGLGSAADKAEAATTAPPKSLPWSSELKNKDGKALEKKKVTLRFTIHDKDAKGKVLYQETQTEKTDDKGKISVKIGEGKASTGKFAKIDWSAAPRFLQVELDADGKKKFVELENKAMADPTKPAEPAKAAAKPADEKKGDARPVVATAPASTTPAPAPAAPPQKPGILPVLTQAQIDALKPIEGMVLFNSTTHKVQVFASLVSSQQVTNEMAAGATGNVRSVSQTFIPPITGHVVQIEVMIQNPPGEPLASTGTLTMPGYSQKVNINSNPSFRWAPIVLDTPQEVTKGVSATFAISTDNNGALNFATNSQFPDGTGCCWKDKANDLVFRIYIQPAADTAGWQNLH